MTFFLIAKYREWVARMQAERMEELHQVARDWRPTVEALDFKNWQEADRVARYIFRHCHNQQEYELILKFMLEDVKKELDEDMKEFQTFAAEFHLQTGRTDMKEAEGEVISQEPKDEDMTNLM